MTQEEKMKRYAEAAIESFKNSEDELLSFDDYYNGFVAGAEWARNPKEKLLQASFRIVRDHNGEFRVEVLDRTIDHWYIVTSKLGKGVKGFNLAINFCRQFVEEDEQ